MNDARLLAGQAVGMLFALAVGVLIGARACGPEVPTTAEIEPPTASEPDCNCPGPALAAGPEPDAGEVPDVGPPAAEKPTAEPARPAAKPADEIGLPDAPEPRTPAERRQLLAWVRDRSPSVASCSNGAPSSIRTTITLELGDEGEVDRVTIVDPSGEIDRQTERCLRREMMKWEPPAELVQKRDRLIFGLVI